MFSNLHQGNILYILYKDIPELKIGTITNVNIPNTYSTYLPSSSIDLICTIDGEQTEFKQLPSALSVASYNNTIVSDNKDIIQLEIENMMKTSKLIIDSIPYHESVLKSGEEMIKTLNPQYAQLKDLELKIMNLETKVGGIEDKLDNISDMLLKVINK